MAFDSLSEFKLVGGTALALQLGHRHSVDIDMFCFSQFDRRRIEHELMQRLRPEFNEQTEFMLQFHVNGIKVDLIRYPYAPNFDTIEVDGIRMLDLRDIATMKLNALTNRGAKKDFYDIYFLLRKMSLGRMLELYCARFGQNDPISVVRSLDYFADAERHLDPYCIEHVTWAEVKETIRKEVRGFLGV
jgi:predicted nucleotidyltransferase component of viral defense system